MSIINRTISFQSSNQQEGVLRGVVRDKCLNGYNQQASGTMYLVEVLGGSVRTVLPNQIRSIERQQSFEQIDNQIVEQPSISIDQNDYDDDLPF